MRNLKKGLCSTLLLIITLVFSSYPVSAQGDNIQNNGGTVNITNVFNDIKVDNWAYQAVSDMSKRGVISGYQDGSFKPQDSISREEFATLISKTFNLDLSVSQDVYFSDIPVDRWSYKYIAASKDYLTGYYPPKGKAFFDPEAKASREDVAVALVKVLNLSTGDSSVGTFKDYDQISPSLRKYIDTATANNLISGYEDGTFRPQEPVSRAEAAMLLYRSIKNTADAPIPTKQEDTVTQTGLPDQGSSIKTPELWFDLIAVTEEPGTVKITGTTTPGAELYVNGNHISADGYNEGFPVSGEFRVDDFVNKDGTYQYVVKASYHGKDMTVTKSINVILPPPKIIPFMPETDVTKSAFTVIGNSQYPYYFSVLDNSDRNPYVYVNGEKRYKVLAGQGLALSDGPSVILNVTHPGDNIFDIKVVNKYGKESGTVTVSVYSN